MFETRSRAGRERYCPNGHPVLPELSVVAVGESPSPQPKFCYTCGAKIERRIIEINETYCAECGCLVSPSWGYCPYCGKSKE
jgi:hypothetical protein